MQRLLSLAGSALRASRALPARTAAVGQIGCAHARHIHGQRTSTGDAAPTAGKKVGNGPESYKEMKQTLKSFLKEVHPDRFAHAPQKQAVNERSLADLNAFIDSVEGAHPLPKCTLHLEFYRNTGEEKTPAKPKDVEEARHRRLRYTLDLASDARYRRYVTQPEQFASQCLRRLLERAGLLDPLPRVSQKRAAQKRQADLRAEMEAAFAKDLPYMHDRGLGSKARPRWKRR